MLISLKEPAFKINPGAPDNMLDDPHIHIVATALKKDSFCLQFLSKKMSVSAIAHWCDLVNDKEETGTFAVHRFTLFPLKPQRLNQQQAIQKFMPDVITAHRDYYKKCHKVLFLFDHASGYNQEAKSLVESFLNREAEKETWLAEIDFELKFY